MRFGYAFGVRRRNLVWLLAGPASAVLIMSLLDLVPGKPEVTAMAGIAIWVAIWWTSEALPLAATALVPVVMFPTLGIMPEEAVAGMYFNSTILLFLGGMIIALAMEQWNLHRRIALYIMRAIGLGPGRLVLGFMVATAVVSAWMSNTATAMMMLPIGLAVIAKLEEQGGEDAQALKRLEMGLLLGIAFAASIGGMATLVGTPPNMALVEIFHISYPEAPEISFTKWAIFATPFSVVMLILAWLYLRWAYCRGYQGLKRNGCMFHDELKKLGPMCYEEKAISVVFLLTALLWFTRSTITLGTLTLPGWGDLFSHMAGGKLVNFVDDGTVAITMAVLLFMIPTKKPHHGMLVGAEQLKLLPWGILILFGGGFALAGGFKASGLSTFFGERMSALGNLPPLAIVLAIVVIMTLLTNMTSNTASTQMVLPLMVTTAAAIQIDPLLLMIPVTLAASCAFMLPAGTPPNAVVFGANRLTVAELARAGAALSLISTVLIIALIFSLGRGVLGIDTGQVPEWARMAQPAQIVASK